MEKQLIEEISDGVATLPFNRPDRLNALSTPIIEGLLEALPRLALGCRRRKGLTTLLAERHVRHLAGEHKLCETPANQCTLTLLPFDLKLYKRTSLERARDHLGVGPDCFLGDSLDRRYSIGIKA